jgi:hypothetical protein
MEVSCSVLHGLKLLNQPKHKRKTCKPKHVEKWGHGFYHFSYFHILLAWPTPGLPGTQFPMRWLKRIIIVLKSVNNFPSEYWDTMHLKKPWNMLKMLHNFPHRPITTTPRLKPFEFLDITHSSVLSGWVGLSWVLGFRV